MNTGALYPSREVGEWTLIRSVDVATITGETPAYYDKTNDNIDLSGYEKVLLEASLLMNGRPYYTVMSQQYILSHTDKTSSSDQQQIIAWSPVYSKTLFMIQSSQGVAYRHFQRIRAEAYWGGLSGNTIRFNLYAK